MVPGPPLAPAPLGPIDWPENPVLVRAWRGDAVESVHRGTWCLVEADGALVAGAGAFREPFWVRSAIKCVQALPLIETGAADRFGFTPAELALVVSSHNAEPCHVEGARALLERLGLDEGVLACGPQTPGDPDARFALRQAGERGGRIHNNCSGKHAGFLALGRHLGADPADYVDPEGVVQRHVRAALRELTDLADDEIGLAIDGCSAPTFRLPLASLALAFARVTNPEGLLPERREACRRIVDAVRAHPVMLAGSVRRVCTDLVRVSDGALFPKIGAEAVYAVGLPGRGQALAIKMDDGAPRGLHALLIALLEHLGLLDREQVAALAAWRQPVLSNWAGLEVGRLEVDLEV